MQKNNEWDTLKRQADRLLISDQEADELVADLLADGIVVSREEARQSIYRLATLLLLISEPLPLAPGSTDPAAEDQSLERGV